MTVKQLIPDSDNGFYKNINELTEEYRHGNLECLAIVYRRKDEGSTRTYFIGADSPPLYLALKRIEHDMLGLYAAGSDLIEF